MKPIIGLHELSPMDEIRHRGNKQRAYVKRNFNGGVTARLKKGYTLISISELELQRNWELCR